jgi:recombination protein RecA
MNQKELKKFIDTVNKKFNGTVLQTAEEDLFSDVKIYIPTGVPTLDIAIGGGIPVGRATEVYGFPKCGKSTLAVSICAQAQKMGGLVFYFDSENALAKDRAAHLGLDLQSAVISMPSSIQEVERIVDYSIEVLKESDELPFVLFVWDTPAFTLSEEERGADFSRMAGAARAAVLKSTMRKIIDKTARSRVAFLALNHATATIGARFPGMIDVPGGSAFKFGASVQIQMKAREGKEDKIMDGDDQVGFGSEFKIEKTRLSVPKRKVWARLNFFTGFDVAGTVYDHLIERKVAVAEGRKYVLNLPDHEPFSFTTGAAGEAAFREWYGSSDEIRQSVHRLMVAEYEAIIPWKTEVVVP